MKAWNPSTRSYQAAPPMPEFVGQWHVPGGQTKGLSSLLAQALSRVARGAANVMGALSSALEPAPRSGETVPACYSAPMPIIPMHGEIGRRVVMPMSSGVNIRPGQPARIKSRPQISAFRPERIIIGGDPNDWIVTEIMIGRRSQLCDDGELPGIAFSAEAEGLDVRLDTVMTAQNFTMQVEYVGSDPDGAPFACSAMGSADDAAEGATSTNRIYLPLSSGVDILPNTTAMITSCPQDPFLPERIIIGGDPKSWIVNDIKVGNRSQLAQSGDIPGVAFSVTSRGTEISFETVQSAMNFCIYVTYVGDKKGGEPFRACALGSVPLLT